MALQPKFHSKGGVLRTNPRRFARRLLPFAFVVVALVVMTGVLHGQSAIRQGYTPPTSAPPTTIRVDHVVPVTTTTLSPAALRAQHQALVDAQIRAQQAAHVNALRVVQARAHAALVAHQALVARAHAAAVHAAAVRAALLHAAAARAAALRAAQARAAAAAAAKHHPTTTTVPVTTTTGDPTSTTDSTTTTTPVTTTTVAKPTPQPKPKHVHRVGIATWYSYVPGHCATSWVPHGQRVYFRALNSTHWFSCLVTDTQPRSPNRVLDLSMTQFELLAPLWKGVVQVIVVW